MSNKKKQIPGGARFFKKGTLLTVKATAHLRQTTKSPSGLGHRPGIGGPSAKDPHFILYPDPQFVNETGKVLPLVAAGDTFLVLSARPRWFNPETVSLQDNHENFSFFGPDAPKYNNRFWYAVKVLAEDKVGWLVLLNDKSPKAWFMKPGKEL